MPAPGTPLDQLGFLTIGTFDPADPGPGHEATLAMAELGERLGLDSAWMRYRHLQLGITSHVAVLAAASPRSPSAPAGSGSAPPSRRWRGRTRCGWPRTSPPSTSSPVGGSTRA